MPIRRLYICILAAVVLFAVPVRADDISATTLPSGMKVIVREGHAVNLAAIDIWVRAGSINETAEKCGVSHFIEHMIFKATDKYGPGQIDREIEGLGADLGGGTTKDWVHFYTTVPSADLSTAVNAIADAIANPKFRAEDMEKERRIILDEIARTEGDPIRYARDLLAGVMFPDHPYGRPMAGTRDTVARLTRDDLVSYYSAHFTPANTSVVIAGDVSKADAVAMVEKAFEGFGRAGSADVLVGTGAREDTRAPGGETNDVGARLVPPATDSGGTRHAPTDDSPQADTAAPRIQRFPYKSLQSYVAVGFRVPGVAEFKDTCVLDALLILFGDTAHGRIATALTAAGIPFTRIKCDYVTHREPSVFSVTAAVEPANADKAVEVIRNEFRKLTTGVTEGELSYAKRLIEGSDLFDQETFAGQARALGYYDSIRSYDFALKYMDTVRSITPPDVYDLTHKYFDTEGYAATILDPEVGE